MHLMLVTVSKHSSKATCATHPQSSSSPLGSFISPCPAVQELEGEKKQQKENIQWNTELSLKFLCCLLCLQLLDNPVQHLPSLLKLQVSPSHLAVHFLQVLREIGMGIVIILLSYWQAQVPSITLENKQDFIVCFVLVFQARALVAPIHVFMKDQCIHIQAPHTLTFCAVTGLLPHVLCSTSFPPS